MKINDIAVLKTETTLDPQKIPVLYGEPAGLIYGQIGTLSDFQDSMEENRAQII